MIVNACSKRSYIDKANDKEFIRAMHDQLTNQQIYEHGEVTVQRKQSQVTNQCQRYWSAWEVRFNYSP